VAKLFWAAQVMTFICLTFGTLAFAKDLPVQARAFIGANTADPENLNTELTAGGLKKLEAVGQIGAEVVFPVFKLLSVGIRYSKRANTVEEISNGGATDYKAVLDQQAALAVLRVPLFKTSLMTADIFAGYGGTNTTLELKTATQDGKFEKKTGDDWFANTMSSYGASIGVGFKRVYLIIEGGVENNKVDNFKRTGTLNTNVNEIDLSGSFVTIGIMFDGASLSKK
jgi:hypothetical protein